MTTRRDFIQLCASALTTAVVCTTVAMGAVEQADKLSPALLASHPPRYTSRCLLLEVQILRRGWWVLRVDRLVPTYRDGIWYRRGCTYPRLRK